MLIRIAVVCRDDGLWERFRILLGDGDVLLTRGTAEEIWSRPDGELFDLAIVDEDALPSPPGPAIERLARRAGNTEVIFCAGRGSRDLPMPRVAGCAAVLRSDLGDEQLAAALSMVLSRRREVRLLRLRAEGSAHLPLRTEEMVSRSPKTTQILKMANRVARSDTSLLILGETGAGKDWLARVVHGESPRAAAPFIAVNCGAVPESLLESELFGHVKGAFTGATRDRRGFFELAHRGTLYLDEIGEMAPHLQVRLLRVLQDRVIQRIGSEKTIDVDVRIIAATNCDLRRAMEEGRFRQDLYYRLAVVTLAFPGLRERREDIPELARIYLGKFVRKLARPEITDLSPEAIEALGSYDWPGNVRELINVVERAVLLAEGPEIELSDLPAEIAAAAGSPPATDPALPSDLSAWLDKPLDDGRQALAAEFERRYLAHQLERFHGNLGRTAEQAGIDPRTLYSKMRQLGLHKEDFKGPQPAGNG